MIYIVARRWARLLGIVLYLVSVPQLAFGATPETTVQATRSLKAPPVSGNITDLADPIWLSATKFSGFTNLTTRQAEAENSSVAYVVFGPDAIYCAFDAHQPSIPISDSHNENNVGSALDDYAELLFDTSAAGGVEYTFQTNPSGARYQTYSESSRYDPLWRAKASRTSAGWFAEFVIPFSILKSPQKPPSSWRVNLARYVSVSQQTYSWAFSAQVLSPTDPRYWPTLSNVPAITAAQRPANAELFALSSIGHDRRIFEGSANQIQNEGIRSVGADFDIPVTVGLNVVGTILPDFSNVETDQQITAPQEFQPQYAEYRPFFTQGANFLPAAEIFYSPLVGSFERGLKLEGPDGPFGLGFLNVADFGRSDTAYQVSFNTLDRAINATLSGAQVVLGASHDLANEASVSFTNAKSQVNLTAGFAHDDGTSTTIGGASNYFDAAASISKPNYKASLAYFGIGPQYAPTDAYLAVSDIHGPSISLSANTTADAATSVRSISFSFNADRYLDSGGDVHLADTALQGSVVFHNLLSLGGIASTSSLRSYTLGFPYYVDGTTLPYNSATVQAGYRLGAPTSYLLAYSWGPYPGYYLQQASASATRQISSKLNLSLEFDQNIERYLAGNRDGQEVQKASFIKDFSPDENLSVSYRLTSGRGGYSQPGSDFAVGYKRRFVTGSNLYFEFGSPASPTTLDRVILKYVFFVGSGAGE